MASTSGVDLSLAGLASGLDWKSVVSQLANAERAPETVWQNRQSIINQQNAAFGRIKDMLGTFQTSVQALKDPSLYNSRAAQTSDATAGTATVDAGASLGTYQFDVSQLASAAQLNGTANVGQALSPDGNLNAVTLGTAGFATKLVAGTFTINGAQITIAATDSLQQVFDKIATATTNGVTATYNSTPNQPSSDKITLSSATNSEIVLGSASDTSNFLQVAHLYNNGTGTTTSTSALGSVRLSAHLAEANLGGAITGDTNGQGEFTINGVSITYDLGVDTVQSVLDRINSSAAGVTASYNSQTDGFQLTNKSTGDMGIVAQNVTGNFVTSTGLDQGTLAHGKNLLYTLNGGTTQLVSQSNTITEDSSSIAGLSVTAVAKGALSVTVTSDTAKIKTAIQSFITSYNNAQSYIRSQTASSTTSAGKVTAGILAGDQSANGLASNLRSLSYAPVSITGLSSSLDQLADLGIQTNGQDNTITLSDSTKLDSALTNNLSAIQSLFSDSKGGLAVQLDTFLTNTIGDSGSLTHHQSALTKQSTDIDAQVANLEKTIASDSAHWTTEFQAMELAQSQINQQLNYLTQQINSGNL
jgi:flagellar hook-associated protein 2